MVQMMEFQRSQRTAASSRPRQAPIDPTRPLARTASDSHVAARAQRAGFARINNIERALSAPQILRPPSESMSSSDAAVLSNTETEAERNARELAADKAIVDAELNRYFDEGLMENEDELEDFDIVFYWQVSFPGIFNLL